MGTIVAMSGGFDKSAHEFIMEQTGKEHPRVLFIPTSCRDSWGCLQGLNKEFNQEYGCITDFLLLLNSHLTRDFIKEKIMSADIIYVPGGSAAFLTDVWNDYDLAPIFKEAYDKGAVLSGSSAGAICWFKFGNGDSNLERDENNKLIYRYVYGMNLVGTVLCPHYYENDKYFSYAMKFYDVPGIAIKDSCTLVVKDDKYKIIRDYKKACAYKFVNKFGNVKIQLIDNEDWMDLSYLLENDLHE